MDVVKGLICISTCFIYCVNAQYHVASIGNWGYAGSAQRTVADTLKLIGSKKHISAILSPGSNFDGGITGLDDDRWDTQFDSVYGSEKKELAIPFFPVLGVEDWAGNFTAQIAKTQAVFDETSETSSTSPKWEIPNWWYHTRTNFSDYQGSGVLQTAHKDVSITFVFIDTWVLDTNFPYSEITNAAWADLQNSLANSQATMDWVVVVGDKPIYSSGNSGGSDLVSSLLPLLNNYKVDSYISGYDFDMEVISEGSLSFINCGNGAQGRDILTPARSGSLFFSPVVGFCLHTFTADKMTTDFYNGENGDILYTHIQDRLEKKEFLAKYEYIPKMPTANFIPVGEITKTTLGASKIFVQIVGTLGLLLGFLILLGSGSVAASQALKNQ